MATDESYRKKYEGILSGATAQLQQLKSSVEKSGADVKEYGMQVNDGGTTSFFAVLRKSSSDQKSRIQKSGRKRQRKSRRRNAWRNPKNPGLSVRMIHRPLH